LEDLLTDAIEVGAELLQDLGGDPLSFADQPQQDVLGADVVVSELERLAERQLQNLLGPRREGDVSGLHGLPAPDDLLDLDADHTQGDVHRTEGLRGHAVPLVDQAEEQMLGPDVVVAEHPRFLLGEDHDAPGTVGEPLEHCRKGCTVRTRFARTFRRACSQATLGIAARF